MGLLRKIARYALRQTATAARRTAKRALRKAGTRLFSSSAKPTRATTPNRATRKRATTTRKKVRR
jgi:hypothetical protein